MNLITLIILIAVIGFIVWAVITYIPMPQPFKTGIVVLAVVVLLLFVLSLFNLPNIHVGK